MFCPSCGKEISEKSKFCKYCGETTDKPTDLAAPKATDAPPATVTQSADDLFNEGSGCYAAKDYAKAAALMERAAGMGHIEAQFAIGSFYDTGTGVVKDKAQAASWFRKAAERGHANSQFCLGAMYGSGNGLNKDDQAALYWYTKAAELNHPTAQYNLGAIYCNGDIVPRDVEKGLRWFTLAAQNGYADAREALTLYQKSADATVRRAAFAGERCYKHPDSAAVRRCPVCGRYICAACAGKYGKKYALCDQCVYEMAEEQADYYEEKKQKNRRDFRSLLIPAIIGLIFGFIMFSIPVNADELARDRAALNGGSESIDETWLEIRETILEVNEMVKGSGFPLPVSFAAAFAGIIAGIWLATYGWFIMMLCKSGVFEAVPITWNRFEVGYLDEGKHFHKTGESVSTSAADFAGQIGGRIILFLLYIPFGGIFIIFRVGRLVINTLWLGARHSAALKQMQYAQS